jgi:hypothetical protein
MLFSAQIAITSPNNTDRLVFTMETGNIYCEAGNKFVHILLREIRESVWKSMYKTPERF